MCVCVYVCVLLTDLAAVSKCLELSTVTHTALMTPATIKAATVFWESSEQAPVHEGANSFTLFYVHYVSPHRECIYLRRHL